MPGTGGFARALGRRGGRAIDDAPVTRPDGPLIWIFVPDPDRRQAAALLAELLCDRLAAEGCEVTLLVSVAGTDQIEDTGCHGLQVPPPAEEGAEIAAFLGLWRPDLVIWLNGHLRHMLLAALRRHKIPPILVGAEETALEEPRWSRRAGQTRRALSAFTAIHAASAAAARRLQRLGANGETLRISAPLQEGGIALPLEDADREELSSHLAGRPIWLAAMVSPAEIDQVLEAHRRASRMAHRLLLILVPDTPDGDTRGITDTLDAVGWRYQRWSDGELPREETQVLLADTTGDMGLWYSLSPVTFMAGSLERGMKGHDPFEPAAHGSAIIYGPYVSRYLPAYTRLSQAGAARIVRDAEGLHMAVGLLLAPDRAAGMAAAAWSVSTEGAEATDRVVDWVMKAFDERGLM